MDTLKVDEDQPIQAGIISKAIEKAQTRVEGFHFDGRKHILEYDNVISKHRDAIYSRRENVLKAKEEELKDSVLKIIEKEIEKIVDIYSREAIQAESIVEEVKTIFLLKAQDTKAIESLENPKEIIELLHKALKEVYLAKEAQDGKEGFFGLLKFVNLKTIDFYWTEHLVSLEHLKESVSLRAYGGRDPLIEYKTEAHKLFLALQNDINSQISRTVLKISMN